MAIAFVASTLPYVYLRDHGRQEDIRIIYCASQELYTTYLGSMGDRGIQIRSLGTNRYDRLIWTLFFLAAARYKKELVVFFHECCWLDADIGYLIFRPEVRYIPQVTLTTFSKVSACETQGLIGWKARLLSRWFNLFTNPSDGGCGVDLVFSIKNKYGSSIPEGWSYIGHRNSKLKSFDLPVLHPNATVLIVSGRETIPDNIARNLYTQVIEKLIERGFEVALKEHPNPRARLDIPVNSAVVTLSPEQPVEMLLEHYGIVIGFASTSLAQVLPPSLAISLIGLVAEEYAHEMETRMLHLHSLAANICIPGSITEFEQLLMKHFPGHVNHSTIGNVINRNKTRGI